MQIHELNQRPRKVNEANIFGPTGLAATARQIGKAALGSSTALGSAEQSAAQASAAASAQKLAAQGYQTGGSIKPQVTLTQQLAAVKSNPAVQQQVKNLTAQWQKQGAAIVASLKGKKTIPEAVVIGNPEQTKDPKERQLLDLFYKQQAAKDQPGATPAAPTRPDSEDKAEVNQQLEELALEFTKWSDARLATDGITMDTVRQDPSVNKILSGQLTKIAIETMANPGSVATTSTISEYFNIAIAAIQATLNNSQPRTARTRTAAAPAAPAGAAAPANVDLLTQLQQQGVSMTRAELEKLGQVLTTANGGSNVIRNTGNDLLNNIAIAAGLRVA